MPANNKIKKKEHYLIIGCFMTEADNTVANISRILDISKYKVSYHIDKYFENKKKPVE
jgi:Fic family protein